MSEPWITGPVWPKRGYHRPDWGLPLLFLRFKEWRWKLQHKGTLPHRHCSCAYSTECCTCKARDPLFYPHRVERDALEIGR